MKGLEPLRRKASDFKSDVSTISPHRLSQLIIVYKKNFLNPNKNKKYMFFIKNL